MFHDLVSGGRDSFRTIHRKHAEQMLRKSRITWVGALLAASLALATASPAAAVGTTDPQDDAASPDILHERQVGDNLFVERSGISASTTSSKITVQRAAIVVTCLVTANNPHHSSGAKGHIYKTRVQCEGSAGAPSHVTIRVRGALRYDKAAYSGDTSGGVKWSTSRSSAETRVVATNNSTNTFYTPRKGGKGATARGHYQGVSTVEIVAPTGQKIGSDISQVVFRK